MTELTINQVLKQFQEVFGDISYKAQQNGSDKVYAKGTVIDTKGMTEFEAIPGPLYKPKKARASK